MSHIAMSSAKRILKHLLSVGAVLIPLGAVQGQDCGCERSHSCQHHHHSCCPPGLLARLNDLSDAVESSVKSLMPIRSKSSSCDCDSCDSSNAVHAQPLVHEPQTTHQHTHKEPHQHSHPTKTRSVDEIPTPKIDELPIHVPHRQSDPSAPRIPDWLSDPFKDEARDDRPIKVRSASMQIEQPEETEQADEEESILLFDPQAKSRAKNLTQQILQFASKKQSTSHSTCTACAKSKVAGKQTNVPVSKHSHVAASKNASVVASKQANVFVHETVRIHITDKQLDSGNRLALGSDRGSSKQLATVKINPVNKQKAEQGVVQAAAFAPVYVAPLPRRD
jgi:hypothetical protein